MPNMKCLGSVFLVNVTVNLRNCDGREKRDIRDRTKHVLPFSHRFTGSTRMPLTMTEYLPP